MQPMLMPDDNARKQNAHFKKDSPHPKVLLRPLSVRPQNFGNEYNHAKSSQIGTLNSSGGSRLVLELG
jgi:hypothetical protein